MNQKYKYPILPIIAFIIVTLIIGVWLIYALLIKKIPETSFEIRVAEEEDRSESNLIGDFIDNQIKPKEVAEEVVEAEIEVDQVKITKTETGWLNVRSGPGTSYQVVTKVNPDELYNVLSQEGLWYQIELTEETGWVHSKYVELIETN